MNVFDLRKSLVADYADYIGSFIRIRDPLINAKVERELESGLLWPEPLIQLNPAFEPGEWIDELVAQKVLHESCARVFRRDKEDPLPEGRPLRLHRHQADAIRIAAQRRNYVLTTGTGSGKSLSYIVPIVDHVLRKGSGRGIQAVVVYPMNALANSQAGELEKFLKKGFPDGKGPVTYARYTGQESDEEKNAIIASPPDILLTNYVMLELVLTRPGEKNLIKAAQGLRFLVFDELHTYRGRQGADVAMLIRRVRDRVASPMLQCVGTSATLSSEGSFDDQRRRVAEVASQLFGAKLETKDIIGETLRRATDPLSLDDAGAIERLRARVITNSAPPADYQPFVKDPLSSWLEHTFGVREEPSSGRLVRATPRRIAGDAGVAADLANLVGADVRHCERVIEQGLLAGFKALHPETRFPAFAFRLHQFISKGDAVYATVEAEDTRTLTVHQQTYASGDRSRILLPLSFCRECGQEYYVVRRIQDVESREWLYQPRPLSDRLTADGKESGYLYLSSGHPWPVDLSQQLLKVPEDWLEEEDGQPRLRDARKDDLPRRVTVSANGKEEASGIQCSFIPAPFKFCVHCGVSYGARQASDFGKLSTLGSEGRSTATTVLSLSAIRHLKRAELPAKAKKLLSFTDNRQDASLQAGHFNDFVEVGLLRAALFNACKKAGPQGITHESLARKAFEALNLPLSTYAVDPEVMFLAKAETEKALVEVLGYRLYRDLRRGWRITSPNLEQCGLLEIRYLSLDELAASPPVWNGTHPLLASASPELRFELGRVLLDYMRRELAIKVDYLSPVGQDRIRQMSSQRLNEAWRLDENERLEVAGILFPRSRRKKDFQGNVFLSSRGVFGQYLRKRLQGNGTKLTLIETQDIIRDLLSALRKAGLVEMVVEPKGDEDVPGYQVPASALCWVAGDGSKGTHDPLRMPNAPAEGLKTNPFFVAFYDAAAIETQGLEAREHTAQVPADVREGREELFRNARLPILYCSPTMELGVDISELNVVNMRNVPPTPANYAQRSGRAGRSGQPALVFTYCSTTSQHDQYFFKRPNRMVAGQVAAPRLDLSNEELLRSHIHAIWLAETGRSLGTSLREILAVNGDKPSLALLEEVQQDLAESKGKTRAKARALSVLETILPQLEKSDWFHAKWLDDVLERAPDAFDRACERWRTLYRSALSQREVQNRVIGDASRSADDKAEAKRLRREAEAQLELLTDAKNISQSDFYSYRYMASEGFLPGYSFPRLPLSAYLPGRYVKGDRDEYLSRPRFLAISEFGPRAVVYHEGSRYLINKVILPVGDDGVLTSSAKQCDKCGYLHPFIGGAGPDLCERCKATLPIAYTELFRLQNVSTKRRDKINSDEEERLRLGFEVRTGIRFAVRDERLQARTAEVVRESEILQSLTYGQAATIWRMNLGWKRRKNKDEFGFMLDVERGYWAKNELADDEVEDNIGPKMRRVIPYVEDYRNCLLLTPPVSPGLAAMASLQAALKSAIQVVYQLEENELAAEPLPNRDEREVILFFEASEGGAGVLKRLVDDPVAMREVAREALRICHFDPDTGEDKLHAPASKEVCYAACYDCLMSYGNQGDHLVLDRHLIRDLLLAMADSTVKVGEGPKTRSEHLQALLNLAGSELERAWLEHVNSNEMKLPTKAQHLLASAGTRPDFIYETEKLAVYVDGPVHQYPERHRRDGEQQEVLEDLGWRVLRFSHLEDWPAKFARYPHIFGKAQ